MRPLFEERPNKLKVTYESFVFRRRQIQRAISPEMCVPGNTKSLPAYQGRGDSPSASFTGISCKKTLGSCPCEFTLCPHSSCDQIPVEDLSVCPVWFVLWQHLLGTECCPVFSCSGDSTASLSSGGVLRGSVAGTKSS